MHTAFEQGVEVRKTNSEAVTKEEKKNQGALVLHGIGVEEAGQRGVIRHGRGGGR